MDIFREENEIVVQMKNVSKDELTFNPQEITERFVRLVMDPEIQRAPVWDLQS